MKKDKILQKVRVRRTRRTRAVLTGSAKRPRLSVFRSNNQIYAQLIDDAAHKTLVAASSRELPKDAQKKKKSEQATLVGELLAKRAKEKEVTGAIFDRGRNRFHGRVKALAEGAKQGGLHI